MLFDINTSGLARQLEILSTEEVVKDLVNITESTLSSLGISYRERIFTPFVTLFSFLSQVFNDDGSCRRAVMELAIIRKSSRKKACSSATGSFCKAKERLPLVLIQTLVRFLAGRLSGEREKGWKHGRVFVVDGTGFSMPDTQANADVFVRHGANTHTKKRQKKGPQTAAFPIGRILGVFSLTTGAVIDLAVSTWKGKGTGEQSLLYSLWNCFQPSDTILTDAGFSSFFVIASALERNFHIVSEFKKVSHGRINLKHSDQLIKIEKPRYTLTCSLSKEEHAALPQHITLRVVKIKCAPAGFRPKTKFIVTTHLDKNIVSLQDLASLYRERWQVELNFRSIKTVLGMDILRSKSPDMVQKEIWVHMLAYNLIRQKMIEVAIQKKLPATSISFRATQQVMAIGRLIKACGARISGQDLTTLLLFEIVGKRPNRCEPRAIKRRPKGFKLLTESRTLAKTKLHKKSKK